MKIIIDRIEEKFAVAEYEKGKFANVPLEILPDETREGDVILITLNKEETIAKKEKGKEKLHKLFKKNPT